MIEFEGLLFDFDNMQMLNANGREHYIKRLGDMIYIQTGVSNSFTYLYKGVVNDGVWNYVFNDPALNKELWERYVAWAFEKECLE